MPSERINELKPLDAAFSCAGTIAMISAGMAPKANPVPALEITLAATIIHRFPVDTAATA
ncbi:hypothetical protein nbrc107697_18060 [Gordonia crocea]|uniref:Uncharacterized protein n=1 Tax=Gordonia crocea TaxID=589162 RepID=A0A7I9UX48_9ACTN|nr:hypothetical protein nbrc107697_18060 [Gordonia crocea]